jgi:DNA-binding winged helix-turn-helix (wHTH) protein
MIDYSAPNFYEFESFQLDVRRRLLFKEGRPVRITSKAFDILLGLVKSGGRVVSKDEMMSTIWPDCFVEEGNLAQNIFLLRRIFCERKNDHKFIITMPGVGYRFAPYVRESTSDSMPPRRTVLDQQKVSSIAVLPLRSLSHETDSALGVAIADALVVRLCRLRLFQIVPTFSGSQLAESDQYRPRGEGKLKVDALLDGLYQREAEKLRVSIQLIRADDGVMLWADQFDGEFTTLFALEDAISDEVAKALAQRLSGDQPRLAVVPDLTRSSVRRCS